MIRYDRTLCLKCSNAASTGKGNPNWKGGKTYHKAGYAMIRVKNHPRASHNSGYVFEHILVMEKHLGRYLTQGETVHHKNNVKDDNRIENLELWCTNHPSGSRVEDLVRWAKKILRKYDLCR
jgi:hypothetical protein